MIFNGLYKSIKIKNQTFNSVLYEVEKNNIHYALKFLKINKKENTVDFMPKIFKDYEKELQIFMNINSEYIVNLIDNFYDKTNEGYCIVMELCDGDLRDILNQYKPNGLPLNLIKKIFFQLNKALKAMREKDYNHRDIKPENILIKYTNSAKTDFDIRLTDFGLSTNELNSIIQTHTLAGTELYMAPEIDGFHCNNQCDLWSLGVVLYELYTNKYIFSNQNIFDSEKKNNKLNQEISNNRKNGKIVKETDNKILNNLIRNLIKVNVKDRIKWNDYFANEFFKENFKENEQEQIIKIIIKVNFDKEKIKIFNLDIKNIKLILDEKEIKFQKELNNLKKGIHNIKIKINQKITNCKQFFSECKNIEEIEFINFDTKNVTDMSEMFYDCTFLKKLDISKLDTKNVTNMKMMFAKCSSLKTLNINNFDTKNVTNMSWMFGGCSDLINLDISKLNTKNVKNMSFMFYDCKSLNDLDFNNFDTKNVQDMNKIFEGCNIKIDKTKFKNI